MASRAFAFVIWAAVAASAVFWLMRLAASPQPVPAHAIAVADAPPLSGDLSALFGRAASRDAPAPAATAGGPQLKLIGVVAPKSPGGDGVATIAVEGGPPRTYRVGAAVDSDLLLLSVHQRGVALGPRFGQPTLQLELPPLPPPATGTLPGAGVEPAPAAPTARAPLPAPARQALPPPVPVPPPATAAPPDAEPPPPEPDGVRPPQS